MLSSLSCRMHVFNNHIHSIIHGFFSMKFFQFYVSVSCIITFKSKATTKVDLILKKHLLAEIKVELKQHNIIGLYWGNMKTCSNAYKKMCSNEPQPHICIKKGDMQTCEKNNMSFGCAIFRRANFKLLAYSANLSKLESPVASTRN